MIVRFAPEHLQGLRLQRAQAYLREVIDSPGYGQALAATEAYTVLDETGPVACCGILEHHPGRAELWALISPGAPLRKITKAARGWIAQSMHTRIEAHVQIDFAPGHKWAKMLGFNPECQLRRFMPGGVDGVMYSIVRG